MSELDFTVEQRAGTKIAHVDVLSRHVGAVMHGRTLKQGVGLREQAKGILPKAETCNLFRKTRVYFDDVVSYRRRLNENHVTRPQYSMT